MTTPTASPPIIPTTPVAKVIYGKKRMIPQQICDQRQNASAGSAQAKMIRSTEIRPRLLANPCEAQ
jgi:hypothetical protein